MNKIDGQQAIYFINNMLRDEFPMVDSDGDQITRKTPMWGALIARGMKRNYLDTGQLEQMAKLYPDKISDAVVVIDFFEEIASALRKYYGVERQGE